MKHTKAIALMSVAGLALTILPASARPGNRGGARQAKPTYRNQTVAAPVEEALSPEEAATLSFMREEEKLARDVYLHLFDLWGNRVFSNISRAEQRHMDALKTMLDKYGLPDPVADEEGVFNNEDLQDLYDTLILKGAESELAALEVGALIEEVDILDLVDAIEESTHDDLDQVYTNLMNGSKNHLRAFAGQIENLTGEDYEAQFMPQEEVDEILEEAPANGRRGQARRQAQRRQKGRGNAAATRGGRGRSGARRRR